MMTKSLIYGRNAALNICQVICIGQELNALYYRHFKLINEGKYFLDCKLKKSIQSISQLGYLKVVSTFKCDLKEKLKKFFMTILSTLRDFVKNQLRERRRMKYLMYLSSGLIFL